jgi:hypothetical protein
MFAHAVPAAEVAFVARLPPLGYSTFFVQPASGACARRGSNQSNAKDASLQTDVDNAVDKEQYVSLDNGFARLEFDTHTGVFLGQCFLYAGTFKQPNAAVCSMAC